jgi:hypothetical protein
MDPGYGVQQLQLHIRLIAVLFCVMCIVSYCSTTATMCENPFAVKINNNNNNNNNTHISSYLISCYALLFCSCGFSFLYVHFSIYVCALDPPLSPTHPPLETAKILPKTAGTHT